MKHIGILAIDFDSTIAETRFPEIIGLMPYAKEAILKLQSRGWFVIINTCRSGLAEIDAIRFLFENGISFDLINENHEGLTEAYGNNCRKISADIYIDDKNLDQIGKVIDWSEIYTKIVDSEDYIKERSVLNILNTKGAY